jgi:hypothetical protein
MDVDFDNQGYEWHETTTHEDTAVGRRVFIKGRSLNRVTELVHGIEDLIVETGNMTKPLIPREQVLEKLRALL